MEMGLLAFAIQLQKVDLTANSLVQIPVGYAEWRPDLDFRLLIAALYVAKDVLNYSDCFRRDTEGT
jgi:hypothetical protein